MMLSLENVYFRYPGGSFELRIDALTVAESAKVALIGPSGSGKTTLLNLLSGISRPKDGAVRFAGTTVNDLSETRRRDFRSTRIGMVFQNFELIDYLNVFDNVLHAYRLSPALKLTSEVKARARQLASQAGIDCLLKRYPSQLSRGEQQRAAICRALLHRPKLVLADEPTGNLDPANKTRVMEMLFDFVERHDAALLVATHDHGLLDRFDEVVDFAAFHRADAG